jgi:hypothetical protein
MNRLVTDTRRPDWQDREQPDRRQTHDFRYYELIPNSDVPDYRDKRSRYRLKTNSAGMADREYTLARPDGVRRFALVGDSIARGQGAPFGGNFESLLEARLNESHLSDGTRGYEILNFAVGSYNITQMLDTAIVKATPYRPDAYVVSLSDLSVYRRWAHHLALLVYAGIDLKYDYLRTLAREADLNVKDPIGVFDAKLARFRIPTIRWALSEMRAHARRENAEILVLLVPTVDNAALLAEEFLGVKQMLKELKVPYVDLLDTFADVDAPERYRVADNDRHPNAEGHRLLFDRLYARMLGDPEVARIIIGPGRTADVSGSEVTGSPRPLSGGGAGAAPR